MRLLYLAAVRLPTEKAHGLQIMKTCEALAAAGAEVELVLPTRRNTFAEDPFTYYRAKPLFKLRQIGVPDLINFGQTGFALSLLIFSERARWLRSFWQADIIYSRDHLVLLQYVLLGRSLVFEAHAPPTFFSRIVARHAKRVVVISKALASAYEAAGVSGTRITLAPDAVEIAAFDIALSREEARAELGLPQDKKIVAYVGHLYERKGAHTLAEAARSVPDALFVFVGGNPADIKKFTSIYGSVGNIRIEGHVAPDKVPLYLKAANLLVIPNSAKDADSARYTSPMKLFEYMASGTAIVASDVPALKEVLSPLSAYFFTPDDPQALARILVDALEDTQARVVAAQAKELALRYTWQARAEAILTGLSEVTSERGKRL